MKRHARRLLPLIVPAVLAGCLLAGCTDLPINEYGDTPTDAGLKIMALERAAEEIAELDVLRPGMISQIEDLAAGDEHTLLHDRFEEALVSELTRRGLYAGSLGGAGNGDEKPPPESEGGSGSLSYRLVECRVIYNKSGSNVQRRAVAVVHARLADAGGRGYLWADEVTGESEDFIKVAAAEDLIDTRYPDIGPQPPEEEETPVLEPIIATAVTVGLILLFSFNSQ
jgi:hypothetical protein